MNFFIGYSASPNETISERKQCYGNRNAKKYNVADERAHRTAY